MSNNEITIDNNLFIFVAKRNSGKTELIKYIVDCKCSEFDEILLISPTECLKNNFKIMGNPNLFLMNIKKNGLKI